MIVQSIAGGVEVLAPAKLNLFLEVLGRRPDGYHEIESMMVAVNLYDTLTFTETRSGEISLRCNDPTLPIGGENLVVKAAERLEGRGGLFSRGADRAREGDPRTGGAGRRLERRGGDAGGSRSALGPARCPPSRLDALAAEIGSDVAFFMHGPAAVCRGRGERVEPVRSPEAPSLRSGRPPSRREHGRRLPQRAAARDASADRAGPGSAGPCAGRVELGRSLFNRLQPVAEATPARTRSGPRRSGEPGPVS